MERVVGGQRVGARLDRAAHRRLGERERRERDRSGRVRADARVHVSIWRPSISRVTGTFVAGVGLRFMTPAVTVMRSWPENAARAKVTDGTERLVTSASATEIGVSVTSSPKRMSSAPVQPDFWKSEIRMASRRGWFDWTRMLSASLSAGP